MTDTEGSYRVLRGPRLPRLGQVYVICSSSETRFGRFSEYFVFADGAKKLIANCRYYSSDLTMEMLGELALEGANHALRAHVDAAFSDAPDVAYSAMNSEFKETDGSVLRVLALLGECGDQFGAISSVSQCVKLRLDLGELLYLSPAGRNPPRPRE